jgi:hypothetical protein
MDQKLEVPARIILSWLDAGGLTLSNPGTVTRLSNHPTRSLAPLRLAASKGESPSWFEVCIRKASARQRLRSRRLYISRFSAAGAGRKMVMG